jgi:hypothetical protein
MKRHRGLLFSLCFVGLILTETADAAAKKVPATTKPTGVSFPAQDRLGNIFVSGEKVEIQAAVAAGEAIDWTVTDFQGQKVAHGTAPVTDGKVVLAPGATALGFYLVKLRVTSKGTVQAEGVTSYAVVAPIDHTKMADDRFGVVTHFAKTMSTDLVPLLAKAGIANVRDELDWAHVEKTPGKFDFTVNNNRLIDYMADLQKEHFTPLGVMAFGNLLHFDVPKIYPFAAAPHTPEQYQAYARFCQECLKQFGSQYKALEIWNEYNGSFCRGPAAKDRPKFYTEMLKEAYTAIKAVRPDVQVVGGAMVKIPLPYSEKLFKQGALKYMDGIAVHPYEPTPEFADREIRQFVDLMKKYNNGAAKPIWVTECGTWDDGSVERARAAGYLVRMYTVLLAQPEVQRVYWYLARDFQEFKSMGLVHGDDSPMGKYTPVMSYVAYANLIQQLHHAKPVRREATDSRTCAYRFERDGRDIWVCWSTFEATGLNFKAAAPVRVVDLVGGVRQVAPQAGQVTVTAADVGASGFPVYVVAERGVVTAMTEVPRKDQILADSVWDFSGQQGKANWTYGYYGSNKDGSAPYAPDKIELMNWVPSPGDWEDRWFGPSQWFCISQGAASPAAINKGQGWTVRRWTSDRSGLIHVVGHAGHGDTHGDGVCVKVFLDGKEVFTKLLSHKSETNIDLNATVAKGSRLDFVVTPGPGVDASYDATGFRVTILTPPVEEARMSKTQ